MRPIAALSLITFLASACTSAPAPTPLIIYITPEPTLRPSPTSTPSASQTSRSPGASLATLLPQPSQPLPTIEQTGNPVLVNERQARIAWQPPGSSFVHFLMVQEVKNVGDTWLELNAFASTYEIYDGTNAVIAVGTFIHAYPAHVGPGETGYLVEERIDDSFTIEDLARAIVVPSYSGIVEPAQQLDVSNLRLRQNRSDGTARVTGQAENIGTQDISSAYVAAIYFNAAGDITGASKAISLRSMVVGEKRAFETARSTPLEFGTIADYFVIAAPTY